ncbi:MAG: hypothetical protein NW217_16780 [Hyphomicrobiaceae bacterium]|nr:hypothetical protein [Hyphomicrobiaceae bacterium]
MFDFGRIGEMVSGLLGGALQDAATPAGLLEVLEQAGIDPTSLAGLDQGQILELLSQHGVDAQFIENLDLSALSDILAQGDGGQAITEVLSRLTNR